MPLDKNKVHPDFASLIREVVNYISETCDCDANEKDMAVHVIDEMIHEFDLHKSVHIQRQTIHG